MLVTRVTRRVTEGTPNLDWRGFIRLLAWGYARNQGGILSISSYRAYVLEGLRDSSR